MKKNEPPTDQVAIIGAGIVGLTIAHRLQKAGQSVIVFDFAPPTPPASTGNAGHIAAEQNSPLASYDTIKSAPSQYFPFGGAMDIVWKDISSWLPFFLRLLIASSPERNTRGTQALSSLNKEALRAWKQLARDLGHPEIVIDEGHYIVWENERNHKKGRAKWLAAQTKWSSAADLRPEHISVPGISPGLIHGAMHIQGSAQIRNLGETLSLIKSNLPPERVSFETAQITSVKETGEGIDLATAQGQVYRASKLVVAAGVRSTTLIKDLGYRVPMIAERGYHIQIDVPPEQWPNHPPIVFEDRSCILTRFSDGVRLASIVEFGSADTAPNASKWRRLEKHAREIGLPTDRNIARWQGSRPTLPDYLPAIGQLPNHQRFFYAFGHNHLGLTQAPITSECIAELISGRPSPIDLTPFGIDRFD